VQDRCRIGKAAGLDGDALEGGHRARIAPAQQVLERQRQVTAHGAAQTSRLQLNEALLARLDQIVVEADLSELVDDHGRTREIRVAQQTSQQRGLPAAKKAGEDRDGDHGAGGRGAMRRETER